LQWQEKKVLSKLKGTIGDILSYKMMD